jgi:hypothetical protein
MDSMFRVAWQLCHSTICIWTATISPNQLQDCFLELCAADMAESEQIDKGSYQGLPENSHIALAICSM